MAQVTPFVPGRPSRQSGRTRLLARLLLRPLDALVPGPVSLPVTRTVLGGVSHVGTLHRDVAVEGVDVRDRSGRVKGEWYRPSAPRDGVMLYLHGSAYIGCSVRTHRSLVSQIAASANIPVFSVEYRLAPRHVFPTAADDIRRAYDWLLAEGYRPDQIVIAGDSAGGHLTLDLALDLLRADQPLPAALVMLSPLADTTFGLARQRELVRRDPMISAEGGRRLVAHYLGDTDPLHPRLTHVVAAHEALPPTLIQAGGAEMLCADAHHLHDMLAASGTDVQLEIWPGQMHVFQALDRLVPEARQAVGRIGVFVDDALDRAAAPTLVKKGA